MKSVSAPYSKLVHGADRVKEIEERLKSEGVKKGEAADFSQIHADQNRNQTRVLLICVYLRISAANYLLFAVADLLNANSAIGCCCSH